ncbi:hypothetical protein AB0P12_21425 [Streptomyces subrutilus]|uniref:Uncharacterized protein n=1 Tax=Streptomyces subrutilus TaxID=36818 RepID=A0A5P2UJK2_9ACTN|nr:hypothetical protein [Streptomyces subrutilus]QEU79170.1 hypothetical protein CP968_13380 [Streptomyces subrutilus]WSJ31641.1 hypothetical protein OG479_21445 [Streptomyces subrutilus]GGZ52404.1 hypothetical protein GCM10010371_09820 [Streptomyces subrutilus]
MDSSSTNQRRMRSGAVALGGMGLLAATLVACGSSDEPDKRCASRTTLEKLNNKECKSGGRGAYYYGGSVVAGKVSGGSFDKSAVTRKGIGGHSSSGSSGG